MLELEVDHSSQQHMASATEAAKMSLRRKRLCHPKQDRATVTMKHEWEVTCYLSFAVVRGTA